MCTCTTILGGGRLISRGGRKVRLIDFPIPIRSSDCIGRYNRLMPSSDFCIGRLYRFVLSSDSLIVRSCFLVLSSDFCIGRLCRFVLSSDFLIVRSCFLVLSSDFCIVRLYRPVLSNNKCRKNGGKWAGRPFQDGFCGGFHGWASSVQTFCEVQVAL
jgi:hypothetical protein